MSQFYVRLTAHRYGARQLGSGAERGLAGCCRVSSGALSLGHSRMERTLAVAATSWVDSQVEKEERVWRSVRPFSSFSPTPAPGSTGWNPQLP